jgi:hypothetical protein
MRRMYSKKQIEEFARIIAEEEIANVKQFDGEVVATFSMGHYVISEWPSEDGVYIIKFSTGSKHIGILRTTAKSSETYFSGICLQNFFRGLKVNTTSGNIRLDDYYRYMAEGITSLATFVSERGYALDRSRLIEGVSFLQLPNESHYCGMLLARETSTGVWNVMGYYTATTGSPKTFFQGVINDTSPWFIDEHSLIIPNPTLAGTETYLEGLEVGGTKYALGKKIYCHPIKIFNTSSDNPRKYRLTCLIFNNSLTPFTRQTFKTYLDNLFTQVGNNVTIMVCGGYNDGTNLIVSASYLIVSSGVYTIVGMDKDTIPQSTGPQTWDALLPESQTTLEDGVNQIN